MNTRTQEVDFLASVTHDLKSPLNAILCTLEMMRSGLESAEIDRDTMHRHLNLAHAAGADMLTLVNDMLTTARMQAGKETPNPDLLVRSELIERANNIERTFHNEALGKSIAFSVEIRQLPEYVYWDVQKIRFFAINNLISNALKFCPQGGEIRVVIDCDEQSNVLVSVMDDGPGIPLAERAGVFGKFVQASNNTRNFQGGGFGLYNAHQTIAMHGGRMEVLDGLNGRGVTFRAIIPAVPFVLDETANLQLSAAA